MVMDQVRKELKSQEDKQFSVFDDIPKELYEIRKSQIKSLKKPEAKAVQYISAKHNQISYLLMVNLFLQMLHWQILFRYEHRSLYISRDKNVHVNIILSSEFFFHSALK